MRLTFSWDSSEYIKVVDNKITVWNQAWSKNVSLDYDDDLSEGSCYENIAIVEVSPCMLEHFMRSYIDEYIYQGDCYLDIVEMVKETKPGSRKQTLKEMIDEITAKPNDAYYGKHIAFTFENDVWYCRYGTVCATARTQKGSARKMLNLLK